MIKLLSLVRKLERRYRELGFIETVRYSTMRAIDITQEHVFDRIHGVDTAGVALPTVTYGQGYKGSPPHLMREVLNHIRVCYQDYTFIDLGSGKGRTLLIASEFPFRRIIGVEVDPTLNATAQSNLARYRTKHQKCKCLTSVCADVREFEFPLDPLIIYLFNPFTEGVIRDVLERVQSSVRQRPRPVSMVYLRPLFSGVIEETGFLKQVTHRNSRLITNYNYAIYGNDQYLCQAAWPDALSAANVPVCGMQADVKQIAG